MAAGQSVLAPEDFTALEAFQVYVQAVRGNTVQPWASGVTLPPPKPTSDPADIRARSRERYAVPVADVEADLRARLLQRDDTTTRQGRTGRRARRPGTDGGDV
jgi:hypothetical protein